jgi:hypothetical protein
MGSILCHVAGLRAIVRRGVGVGLLPALAVLLIGRGLAQDSSPDAQARSEAATTAPQVMEEVIARGRRLSEIEFDLHVYIREFLEEIAAPTRGRGYARWHRDVCVGVHNLDNEVAQYLVDRVSALALEVGLEPGEPGCEPQVNIIFSTDARQMAADMVDSEPRLFRPVGGHAGMDLGLEGLDEFVGSEKVVRWWQVSLPVDSRTGVAAIEVAQDTCSRGIHCYPTIAVAGPSRVHSGIRDDMQYVIIIVDATKLRGTTWEQLGDYLALVSLAQIDPNANPQAFDSILNLFSNPAAYSGLTDWDRSYIRALYAFDQERVSRIQGNEIVGHIASQERAGDE